MTHRDITIVLADDHPLFRKGLRHAIEEVEGLKVVGEAADGDAALELINTLQPHVVVLDIDMPKKNGLEVAEVVQRQFAATAVVFLTIYEKEDLFTKAMDLGARGYVLKETAVIEVVSCIKAIAEGNCYISPALSTHLMARSTRARRLVEQQPGLQDLTAAERRILRLIAESKTSKEIADELHISYKTVETHRSNIALKLDLRGSHALLKFALENKSSLHDQ